MYVLVDAATRQILDASNIAPWQADATREVMEIPGADENAYPFPGGERTRCTCAADGTIAYAPALDVDAVRDAYVAAKAAMVEFNANATLATAKPAIIKLGLCVEELLKFLKHRIA
jgi:hypothetical protein